MNKFSGVHAVVVTYEPNFDTLRKQIAAIINQVDAIWIVDNFSPLSHELVSEFSLLSRNCAVLSMGENLGLGAAQNIGIQRARKDGAKHVLILDQDSLPMAGMVDKLLDASNLLHSKGVPVAAVAPINVDVKSGIYSGFVSLGWLGYKKHFVTPDQAPVGVDFVISSGSLIPVSSLNDIGLIDEDLFIDHVDTEWCMRALSKGFKLFGVPSARMFHSLGNNRKRVWFLRWRNVPYHSPFRYYYMLRNGVLLRKRSYIPLKWRIGEFMRSWQMLVFFGLWGEGSFKRLTMMLRGLVDGYKGVHGPMPRRHD